MTVFMTKLILNKNFLLNSSKIRINSYSTKSKTTATTQATGKRSALKSNEKSIVEKGDEKFSFFEMPMKPKRPVSGYILFVKERFDQVKGNDKIVVSDISKQLSQQWKELSKEEKSKYTMNEQERKEYKESMDKYNEYMKKKLTVKQMLNLVQDYKKTALNERNQLKRISPYTLFIKEQIKLNPGLRLSDVAKIWSTLDEQKKASYQTKASQLNEDYQKRLNEWKLKYNLSNII